MVASGWGCDLDIGWWFMVGNWVLEFDQVGHGIEHSGVLLGSADEMFQDVKQEVVKAAEGPNGDGEEGERA